MKKLNYKEIRELESGDLIEVIMESNPIVKGHLKDVKRTSTFVELIFGSKTIQVPTLETSSDKVEVFLDDKFDKYKTSDHAKILLEYSADKLDEVKQFVQLQLVGSDSIFDCFDNKCLMYVPAKDHGLIRDILDGTMQVVTSINIYLKP